MGIRSIMKEHLNEGLNVKKWLGVNHLKQDTKYLKNMITEVLSPDQSKADKFETFEQCLLRLQLTETDVVKRMRTHLITSVAMFILTIFLAIYMGYLTYCHLYRGTLLCAVLTMLVLTFAFREHFYYFQMKKRRLGCTVMEWVKFLFLGR